jgi:hypothetical protein
MQLGRFTTFVLVFAGGLFVSYALLSACNYGVHFLCGHNAPLSFLIGSVIGWVLLAAAVAVFRSKRNTS